MRDKKSIGEWNGDVHDNWGHTVGTVTTYMRDLMATSWVVSPDAVLIRGGVGRSKRLPMGSPSRGSYRYWEVTAEVTDHTTATSEDAPRCQYIR